METKMFKKFFLISADLLVVTAFFLQATIPALAEAPASETSLPAAETTVQTTESPAVVDSTAPGDPSSANTTTGADSQNVSQTDVNSQTNVTNTNTAKTNNNSFLQADTGHNNTNYNTGSGIITTERAKGQSGILNVVNVNSTNVQSQTPSPANAENSSTGANSDNTATTNINNQTVIKNINDSNTINVINANVNSGQNSSTNNTGHGIILTGNADLGLNLVTVANANLTGTSQFYADWQNIFDNYTGDLNIGQALAGTTPLTNLLVTVKNQNTGSGSTNTAIVNVNNETQIVNQNTGNIDNQINANVVSGQSKANYNTGSGSVTSGKVNASVNAVNFLNSNVTSSNWWMKTFNVYGNFNGNILLPQMPSPNLAFSNLGSTEAAGSNSTTGADSTNNTDINITDTTTISNQNLAVISNDVAMKTNTGNNETSYNNGSGAIKFGEADAETNEVNIANKNITGDSWWVVIVNKFGSWAGAALGAPSDVLVNATSNATVFSPQNSGITVSNDSTGPQSNNSAGANVNHSVDISNSNQAYINNAVNLNAISGENEAQYNVGHGYIETGDIKGAVNLVNFANSNITVGNWLVAVINVFGDWQGNLVFNTPSGPSTSVYPSTPDFSQYSIEITPNEATIAAGGTQTFSAVFKDPSGNPASNQPEFTWSATGGTVAPNQPAANTNNSAGAATSANTGTGSGSDNNSTTNTDTTTNIANTNTADTTTNTSASSTTGTNNANYNTGSGIVATGQANTGADTTNNANNNQTNVGQTSCGAGTDGSSNQTTGADSTNNSTTNNNCSTDVANNNNSTINNNYSGSADTGGNNANYNTGTGAIDTSWANTYVGVYNQENSNQITVGDVAQDFSPSGNGSVIYTAGDTAGTYAITATANGIEGTATINVTASTNTSTEPAENNPPPADNNPPATPASNNGGGGGGSSSGGGGGGGGGGGVAAVLTANAKKYRADLNNDGKVDIYDLSIMMANWGKKMKNKTADINSDGKVSDVDFSILMSDWAKYLAEIKNKTKKV